MYVDQCQPLTKLENPSILVLEDLAVKSYLADFAFGALRLTTMATH